MYNLYNKNPVVDVHDFETGKEKFESLISPSFFLNIFENVPKYFT